MDDIKTISETKISQKRNKKISASYLISSTTSSSSSMSSSATSPPAKKHASVNFGPLKSEKIEKVDEATMTVAKTKGDFCEVQVAAETATEANNPNSGEKIVFELNENKIHEFSRSADERRMSVRTSKSNKKNKHVSKKEKYFIELLKWKREQQNQNDSNLNSNFEFSTRIIKPNDYLFFSIFTTLFCFFPIGN